MQHKKKKLVKAKCEGFLKTMIVLFVLGTVLMMFMGSTAIQSSNSELQRLKSKIDSQEKINIGMQMKINELASLDNALEVADSYGLEYNNKNIRVIAK